jgi:hypothetical protein
MTKYAENTVVPIERSKAEIERILVRYGADQFMYGYKKEKAMVMFMAHNRLVRFFVPMPNRDNREIQETPTGRIRTESAAQQEYEKEVRRRWRALALSIKGKLESVESGIMTFEEEFMANIVLPNDTTVAEFMIPQIQVAYKTGAMPKALPFLGERT